MGRIGTWLAATSIAFGASTAHALPIVTLSATGQTTTSVAGTTTVTFNDGTCGYASCSGNYRIVQGTTSYRAQPAGTTGRYLAVPNPIASGSATFALGTTASYFGLYWGSIDAYNTISFLLGGIVVATYSGTDLVGAFANGNQVSLSSNRYINFEFGSELFDAVRLTSTNYAFESDNHAYRVATARLPGGSVPAPGPLALFGFGLIALALGRPRTAA